MRVRIRLRGSTGVELARQTRAVRIWRREHQTGGRRVDLNGMIEPAPKIGLELIYEIPDAIRAAEFAAAFDGTVE
jgi:hypothetical protein